MTQIIRIVSNHGGRQLDAGKSSIQSLTVIINDVKGKFTIMLASGIRSGPDVAKAPASSAHFTFLVKALRSEWLPWVKGVGNIPPIYSKRKCNK